MSGSAMFVQETSELNVGMSAAAASRYMFNLLKESEEHLMEIKHVFKIIVRTVMVFKHSYWYTVSASTHM